MPNPCSLKAGYFPNGGMGWLRTPLTKGTACRAPTDVGRDGELVVVTHIVPCT